MDIKKLNSLMGYDDSTIVQRNEGVAGDVVDLAQSGLYNTAGGILDFIGADSAADSLYQSGKDQYKTLSPEMRESMNKEFISEDANGNLSLGEGVSDPRKWLGTTVETVAQMAPTMGAGTAVGLGVKALTGASRLASLASAGTSGALGGMSASGLQGNDAYEAVKSMNLNDLQNSSMFQNIVRRKKNQNPNIDSKNLLLDSQEELAQEIGSSVEHDPSLFAVNSLTDAFGDKMLMDGILGNVAKKTALGSAVTGFASEGTTEGVQSGYGQYVSNVEQKKANPTLDESTGVMRGALEEGLVGGVIGGGTSGAGAAISGKPLLRQGQPVVDESSMAQPTDEQLLGLPAPRLGLPAPVDLTKPQKQQPVTPDTIYMNPPVIYGQPPVQEPSRFETAITEGGRVPIQIMPESDTVPPQNGFEQGIAEAQREADERDANLNPLYTQKPAPEGLTPQQQLDYYRDRDRQFGTLGNQPLGAPKAEAKNIKKRLAQEGTIEATPHGGKPEQQTQFGIQPNTAMADAFAKQQTPTTAEESNTPVTQEAPAAPKKATPAQKRGNRAVALNIPKKKNKETAAAQQRRIEQAEQHYKDIGTWSKDDTLKDIPRDELESISKDLSLPVRKNDSDKKLREQLVKWRGGVESKTKSREAVRQSVDEIAILEENNADVPLSKIDEFVKNMEVATRTKAKTQSPIEAPSVYTEGDIEIAKALGLDAVPSPTSDKRTEEFDVMNDFIIAAAEGDINEYLDSKGLTKKAQDYIIGVEKNINPTDSDGELAKALGLPRDSMVKKIVAEGVLSRSEDILGAMDQKELATRREARDEASKQSLEKTKASVGIIEKNRERETAIMVKANDQDLNDAIDSVSEYEHEPVPSTTRSMMRHSNLTKEQAAERAKRIKQRGMLKSIVGKKVDLDTAEDLEKQFDKKDFSRDPVEQTKEFLASREQEGNTNVAPLKSMTREQQVRNLSYAISTNKPKDQGSVDEYLRDIAANRYLTEPENVTDEELSIAREAYEGNQHAKSYFPTGSDTQVLPMQEYDWGDGKVRYNDSTGVFEQHLSGDRWGEISKRLANRFLNDRNLSAPEGYSTAKKQSEQAEDTYTAEQAEAEKAATAEREKKAEQAEKRRQQKIKKQQGEEQVGTFNDADAAMAYARQWDLTETHYPDQAGMSGRRKGKQDWTLRKMPTEKLPNDYIATLFRDPTGKWGNRYFITGDNLQALKPYAAQYWGGKDFKFQLAPKWALDRGVDLAKSDNVLNVPRDPEFLVKLQDAGAYIDTDDYSAMDAMGLTQQGNTEVTPEDAEIDRQLKEGIEVTMSPSGKIQEAPNAKVRPNFTGTDLQKAARLTVDGYRLAEKNMEVWKHQRWLGELDSNLNRVVRERGGEGNFSQNDLGKTIGVTTENMQELRKVIESEGTQGDIVLARKLFPETARKRDAGEKIQLKPYFPQYIPKTERPNTPEIGDAMVVVSANNPRGVKRKYSTADRFYVESVDGDVVTAVSRFDGDKIKLKKASDTTWNVVSRSDKLKVVARLEKASPTRETSREDLRKRWMAENAPKQEAQAPAETKPMSKKTKRDLDRKIVKYTRRVDAFHEAAKNLDDVMATEGYNGKKQDAGKSNNLKVRNAFKKYDKAFNEENAVEGEIKALYKRFINEENGSKAEWDSELESFVDIFSSEDFDIYGEPESNTNVLPDNSTFPAQEGDEATVYTSDGTEVPVRYKVVEASELQTSNNTDFSVNEKFPEELQPRDRSSAALQQQVREMASDLKPERLAESSEADRGAPIVRDGVVESGNGRTIAIKMAYEQGNGKKYKKWLSDHQNRFGIEGVDLFKQPVLVRERLGDMDAREFVVAANEQATAELSTLEQAQVDADRLTDADLELINIPDNGDMLSASNHRFMQRFMQRLGTAQSSGLTKADGTFNKAAGERALNAVFHKAYNNDTLTQMVAEESNPDVKNILTALTRSAPSMASLQTYEQGDVGLSDALADATLTVRQSRRNNQSVAELVAQSDIFAERNPIGDKLAAFMDKNIRSAKRMGDVFTSLAKQIEDSHKRSQTVDMFGDSGEISITDVLQSNTEFVNANTESQAAQGTLDLQQGAKPVRPVSKQSNQPSKQQEKQRAETEAVAKDYGKENKLFTEDAAAKARALLRSKLGTVNSGIDPEIVQAGITLAGYHIEAGARKFNEYASAMIRDLGDVAKPYLRSWYEGVRYYPNFDNTGMSSATEIDAINIDELGGEDVSSTELDTERDSGNAEQEVREPAVSEPVQTQRGRKAESSIDTTRRTLEKRDERQNRDSVYQDQPDSDGAGRDSKLHNDDGTTGIKSSVTRPDQSERSDGTDGQRNVVKSEGEEATAPSTDRPIPSREDRVRLQKEAESKPSKEGDLDNIRETLPILLPEQQEDVHFAEKRFADGGHGVHFANGTGTGKTFSGLGVVKRHQREGKGNILVVTPSNEINKEWFNAAPLFNIDLKALENKQDAGEGVVITTYANFRDNWAVGLRDWDLLVMDESHNLLQKDSTEPTSALQTLRALSGHPKGVNRLNSLLNPELGQPYEALKSKYEKVSKEIEDLEAIKGLTETEKSKLSDLKVKAMRLKDEIEPLAKALYEKMPATRKIAEKRWKKRETNTVTLSATPYSYRKSVSLSEGYLFDYPEVEQSGAYNSADSMQQFFIDTFGYQMKNNKLNEPDAKVDVGLLERQFNEQLRDNGSLRARVLEVEYDYDRKFELIDGGIGSKIDDGFAYFRDKQRQLARAVEKEANGSTKHAEAVERKQAFDKLVSRIVTDFDYQQQVYLLEAIKAKAAVPYIKEHLALGRKVVVFHGYNKGLEANVDTGEGVQYRPFYINEEMEMDNDIKSAWEVVKTERPDLAELAIDDLSKPIDTLSRAFGDKAAFVNGLVSKKVAQQGISEFNKDGSGKDVIVVQQDKGSAGISLHDKTGKHQRVLINLGIPVKPTQSIQIEGRIYRVNLMSDAMFRYFNTGLNFERRMFASRMATRAGTTENLAMGNTARALKDNMIEAFEDSQDWGVGFEGEGVGGKAADRQSNTDVTQWDKAKSFYYTQQKKNSKTKAQEGKDYFATPEPIGLKMVDWLGLKKGDKVLEPSAGHGAISRWFPDGVFGHIVEPSNYLFPKAQMVTNNLDKAHNIEFEEFGTNNKFNGVVMNPPYGTGGKVAMEHVAKAFNHLRRGGRVVALVPEGPAFQKRFDAWLESQPTANHVATVHLPDVTFKRAGTSVRTKIIAIDYIPKGIPRVNGHSEFDLSTEKDVDDLFDTMEDLTLPARQEIADIDVDEVMSDARLTVKKMPKSKAHPARWSVTGGGTYRYKEAIKASAVSEENKPRWNRAKQSWDFPEDNGNPSEAIAENVLKVQRGEDLDGVFMRANEVPDGEAVKVDSISVEEAKREALAFVKKFKGLNLKESDIIVTNNLSDIFPNADNDKVTGFYDAKNGKLAVFVDQLGRSNLSAKEELRATLSHELIVHGGLGVLSDREIKTLFDELMEAAESNPTLKAKRDSIYQAYKEQLLSHQTSKGIKGLDTEGKKLLAEEMLASIAESQMKGDLDTSNKAWNGVKRFFRKLFLRLGLGKLVKPSMFDAELFKIAEALRDGANPNAQYSGERYQGVMQRRQTVTEEDLDQVFAPVREQIPFKEKVSTWWDKLKAVWRQQLVDRYDALRRLDREVMTDGDEMSDVTRSSWVLAKMAGAANGVIEAAMGYGRMRYDANEKTFKPVSENDTSGGFIGFMQSIGDEKEINAFLRWIAGERAHQINQKADRAAAKAAKVRKAISDIDEAVEKLAWDKANPVHRAQLREIKQQRKDLAVALKDLEKQAKIRERFLKPEEIKTARGLIKTGNREAKFRKHYETFKAYQNDFVDAGVATGVISKDAADMWRDEFYLPFYRVMQEDNEAGAPVRSSGLSRQEAYKRFKGADMQVGDLLNNVIQNFSAITTASLKNQAAVQAMDNAMEAGVASEVSESKRNKKASTWVMRKGKKVWYNVDDPLVFDAISSLDPVQLDFWGAKTASKFKSAFTDIVTLKPSFIVRNFMRDVVQTQATSADVDSKSLMDSMAYVMRDIGKLNHEKAMMLATGASFTFAGNYAETSISDVAGGANRALKTIRTPDDAKKKFKSALRGYRDLANNVENANRSAVFKAAKRANKSDLEAAFEARDLMDFGSHGSNTTIRALVSIVPFLNARIQGLDKLARTSGLYNAIAMKTPNASEKQLRKRFALVSGLLMAATAILHAVNVGDPENEEEYRKLTNEQRDLNWYVGGFLVPKPHEIGGFLITPVELLMDELVFDRAEDGALKNYTARTFMNTFSFNPTPQIVKPMVELYMNKNMFTGREIEYQWEQGKSKRTIYDHRTSAAAKGTAEAIALVFGDSFISPKQIDHLIYGYTGWIGKSVSDYVDMAVNAVSATPKPASHLSQNPLVKATFGSFYTNPDQPKYTQDQKRLYELSQDIHRDYKDYRELIKLGNAEEARELAISKGQRLKLHRFALNAQKRISRLNLRKKAVRQNTRLTAAQKRDEIDRIQYTQEQISKNAIKVLNAAGIK